jgi:hypothetical protein
MKVFCLCIFGVVLATAALPALGHAQPEALTDGPGWQTHSIPEFGTRVVYPATIFSVPDGKSQRGTGQRFQTSDGRATFSIYARSNEGGETPASYLRTNLQRPRSALQYRRVTSSFFAISEETPETIFYSRCNFANNGAIHCFDLVYPRREKRAWDPIVTRISLSLRPLRG